MKKLWILLAFVALMAGPVAAGVVYEIEVTDHEQSPPRTASTEMTAEGRNLKMEIAAPDAGVGKGDEMIYRGERREMVVVDHEDQSYHVMNEETLGQIAGQVGSAMAQMQEALKNVPEDKRAMVEQMMKQKMPSAGAAAPERPKSELRKTGEKATKNGYPCVKYEVWRGGVRIREMWVTDWSNVEGGEDAVDVFEDMADFFQEMLDAMPDFGQGPAGDTVFEHMREIGGFPVVTSGYDDNGVLEDESGLRSARRRTLDPNEFEPPSGYRRRSMFPE